MRKFKRIIAAALCGAVMMGSIPAMAAESKILVNESFNDCVTNGALPAGITASGDRMTIREYADKDKGVYIASTFSPQNLTFPASLSGRYFISFDVMADNAVNGNIAVVQGARSKILKIEQNVIMTHNGNKLGIIGGKMKNICICVNQTANTYSVYLDGRCVIADNYVNEFKFTAASGASMEFTSDVPAGIIVDNVNIGLGEYSQHMKFDVAAYNDAADEEFEFSEPAVSNAIYLYEPFDPDKSSQGTYNAKDNILEKTVLEDGEGVCLFRRAGTQDSHLDITDTSVTGVPTFALVYQLDLYFEKSSVPILICCKDTANQYINFGRIFGGGVMQAGTQNIQLPIGEWFTVAFAYNMQRASYDVYLNGKKCASVNYTGSYDHDIGQLFRIHYQGSGASDSFMMDNICIYGGLEPRNLNAVKEDATTVRTDFENNWQILKTDSSEKSFMRNKVGYHLRSGVAYADGKKSIANSVVREGTAKVEAGFFDTAFPGRIAVDGGKVTADGRDITAQLGSKAEFINGKYYLPLRAVCERGLGKKVYYDNSAVSGGFVIISDNEVKLPENNKDITVEYNPQVGAYMMSCSELQSLNDFLFYYRPEMEQVKEDYESSPLYGVHPRVLADKDDFERIRELIKTDSRMEAWYLRLIDNADKLINQEPLVYELRDGVRLLFVADDFLSRISTLAMAYQISGDKKYSERAHKEMEAIASFPGWHPEHHIDVGVMAIGYAIGYDWLYDTYTAEQREFLEQKAYEFGYYEYIKGFDGLSGYMAEGITATNNHNAVMNAGLVMLAAAFTDVFPEASYYLLAGSARASENTVFHFAPAGAWYEGVTYGVMTMRFYSYQLAAMEKLLGTLYSLDRTEGTNLAAEYVLYMQSPAGPYVFSDATSAGAVRSIQFDPGVIWFANHFGSDGVISNWYKVFNTGVNGDSLVKSMLFYSPEAMNADSSLDIDKIYSNVNVEVMRNNWTPLGQVMVGIKGGKANVEHGHLDMGSFSYFTGKTRWIDEIGCDDYNLPRFFNGFTINDTRWGYFRERAEAHSCLVIDPDGKNAEYDVNETAELVTVENKPKGAICYVDMASSFGKERVSAAKRGFFFTDDRQSLVVRDEVSLKKNSSDVYWFAYTNENVKIEGNSVILESVTESGERVRIDFVSNQAFELYTTAPEALDSKAGITGTQNSGTRIVLHAKASGDLTITAKLTPEKLENASSVDSYDVPISQWSVPEGEIKVKPYLDSISAGDAELSAISALQAVLVSEDEPIPEVKAESKLFDVQITQGQHIGDSAYVTVTDKADPQNVSVYQIVFKTLEPTGYPGVRELTIKNVTASDEPQEENKASNVLDRSLATRWSADGAQYLILDLGAVHTFDKIIMAFMDGANRKNNITIAVSEDGGAYTEVFDGTSSCADAYEAFEIGAQNARYVRITGKGYNGGTWNSWTEVAVAVSE